MNVQIYKHTNNEKNKQMKTTATKKKEYQSIEKKGGNIKNEKIYKQQQKKTGVNVSKRKQRK